MDARIGDVPRLVDHQALVVGADIAAGFDEILVVVVIPAQAHIGGRRQEAQAQFHAVAGFRLQVGIGDGGVTEHQVGETEVDVVVGRRAEAAGVAGEQRPLVGETPDQAEFRRHAGLFQLRYRHARIVFGEDAIHVRLQFIAVHAHARHQRQPAIGQAHFVLCVQAQLGGGADGEITYRERIRQNGGTGLAIGQHLETIALLADFSVRAVEAIRQRVFHGARGEYLVEHRLQTMHALIEVELAVARGAVGTRLVGALRGFAVLAVHLPMQAVGKALVQRIHFMGEGHPRTGLPVARRHAGGGGVVDGGIHVGIGVVLVALHRQPEALVLAGRVHQLGQDAATIAFVRVGRGAGVVEAAHLALVFGLLALAVVDVDHAAPALATERGGDAAQHAVPVAVVAEFQADVAVLAIVEIIQRILGDEGDHTTQRVRTIQRTGRTTHDLHPLEGLQIGEIAVGIRKRADVEAGRHGNAVGLDAHAVAIQATDADAADTEAGSTAGGRQAGFVAQQITQVVHQLVIQAFPVDHIDGGGHIAQCTFGTRGRHLHPVEFMGDIGGRAGIGSGVGRQRQRKPQGGAEDIRAVHGGHQGELAR